MPTLLILCAAVLWGLIGSISRFAMRDGVTALEVAFWRAAIAGGLFFGHALWLRRVRVTSRDFPWVLGFGLAGVALLEASNLLAVEKGGAAFAAVLLYSAPAWVAIFSTVFFGEPPSLKESFALGASLLGVAGVALSGGQDLRFSMEAVFWGLVSGLSYALFFVFGRVFFPRYAAPETLYAYAFPFGALALFPLVEFREKTPVAWGALVFVGVASTYLAYLVYAQGLRRMRITRASIIASLEPVVAAVAAYWIWSESLSPWGYFWAAWVVGGIVLAHLARKRAGSSGGSAVL